MTGQKVKHQKIPIEHMMIFWTFLKYIATNLFHPVSLGNKRNTKIIQKKQRLFKKFLRNRNFLKNEIPYKEYKNLFETPKQWCHGVAVINTAQLHSSKPEFTFCIGSIPPCGMSEIRDVVQWKLTEIFANLDVFSINQI